MDNLILMVLAALLWGCGNAPVGESTVGSSKSANTPVAAPAEALVQEVNEGSGHAAQAAVGLCSAKQAPGLGLLPMTWKNSVGNWIAVGTFKVEALAETQIKPINASAAGFIPVTTANVALVEPVTPGAPQTAQIRLWPCSVETGCQFHLKVGGTYLMVLHKVVDPTVTGYSLSKAAYVTLVAQGLFHAKADGGWTNGVLGVTSNLQIENLKAELKAAAAAVLKTGTCASTTMPDEAVGAAVTTNSEQGALPPPGPNPQADAFSASPAASPEVDAGSFDGN